MPVRPLLPARLVVTLVAVVLGTGATAPAAHAETASGGTAALLDAGYGRVCATEPGGPRLFCWGDPRSALGLGRPTLPEQTPDELGPVDLGPGRTARAIAMGGDQTCAILDDAGVRCWGDNRGGRLGVPGGPTIGDDEPAGAAPPVDLGGRPATALSAGEAHTCALVATGSVYCWGANASGQLGSGSTEEIGATRTPAQAGPVDLGTGRTATAVSAGVATTCAILDDGNAAPGGDVLCWGDNGSGQLGRASVETIGDDETPGAANSTVDLGPGRTATSISVGQYHVCATLDTGDLICWGGDNDGFQGYIRSLLLYPGEARIGDDETPASRGGVTVGEPAVGVAAAPPHSCALSASGVVRCWGSFDFGVLGVPIPADVPDKPNVGGPVQLGAPATGVSVGASVSCARLIDEQVSCWGVGQSGALGNGTTGNNVGDDETPATSRVRFPARGAAPSPLAPTAAVPSPAPVPAPSLLAPTPDPPDRGREADVAPVSGTVLVQDRPGAKARRLRRGERLPIGAVVDTRKGVARLTTASTGRATQSAKFSEGLFRVRQTTRAALTTLSLTEPLACTTSRRATTRAKAKAKAKRRRVWGDGTGRFRTDGQYATAAVRGTRWQVEDRCDGTLVKVARGRVDVRDLVRGGTTRLTAGTQRFFPARRASKPRRAAP